MEEILQIFAENDYHTSENPTSESSDEDGIQVNEMESSSSEDDNEINVLSNEEKEFLDRIDYLTSKNEKVEWLGDIKPTTSLTNSLPYNLNEILERGKRSCKKPISVNDLHNEIKIQKQEIKDLKLMQIKLQKEFLKIKEKMVIKNYSEDEGQSSDNISNNHLTKIVNEEYLMQLAEITTRKLIINVTIKINNEFVLETTALFDTGADLNCIREGLIPTKYFEKTTQSLSSASVNKLQINFKLSNAEVIKGNVSYKTAFILVKNLNRRSF